jgi:hypothetical protein
VADKDLPLLFKSPDLMSAFFKISGGTTDQKIDVVAEKFCHLQRDLVEIQYQQLVLLQTISDLVVEDVGSYTLRMPDHRDHNC